MRKVVFFMFTFSLLLLVGTSSYAAPNGIDVDTSQTKSGIVKVKFNTGSTKKIKLLVSDGTNKYYYNLANGDDYVNFPLQFGDGRYTVAIYENTSGTKYKKLHSQSFMVDVSGNDVYLNSIQEIDWNDENEAIKLAQILVDEARSAKGKSFETLTDEEMVQLMYDKVVETVKYDYKKIRNLEYNYLPDIDETLETEKGICYDYSSLLASMLRSQGVPTKLVKGYTDWTKVYHAWNEIYIEDEERWIIVDTTYDSYMYLRGRDYELEKEEDVYKKKKEY